MAAPCARIPQRLPGLKIRLRSRHNLPARPLRPGCSRGALATVPACGVCWGVCEGVRVWGAWLHIPVLSALPPSRQHTHSLPPAIPQMHMRRTTLAMQVAEAVGASRVFVNRRYEPGMSEVDTRVADQLGEGGVKMERWVRCSCGGLGLGGCCCTPLPAQRPPPPSRVTSTLCPRPRCPPLLLSLVLPCLSFAPAAAPMRCCCTSPGR